MSIEGFSGISLGDGDSPGYRPAADILCDVIDALHKATHLGDSVDPARLASLLTTVKDIIPDERDFVDCACACDACKECDER